MWLSWGFGEGDCVGDGDGGCGGFGDRDGVGRDGDESAFIIISLGQGAIHDKLNLAL